MLSASTALSLKCQSFLSWSTSPFQTLKPAHVLYFTNLLHEMLLLRSPTNHVLAFARAKFERSRATSSGYISIVNELLANVFSRTRRVSGGLAVFATIQQKRSAAIASGLLSL